MHLFFRGNHSRSPYIDPIKSDPYDNEKLTPIIIEMANFLMSKKKLNLRSRHPIFHWKNMMWEH